MHARQPAIQQLQGPSSRPRPATLCLDPSLSPPLPFPSVHPLQLLELDNGGVAFRSVATGRLLAIDAARPYALPPVLARDVPDPSVAPAAEQAGAKKTAAGAEEPKAAAEVKGVPSGGRCKTAVYESGHNYKDNENYKKMIAKKGDGRIEIVFDPRCRTESGSDSLWFCENDQFNGSPTQCTGQAGSSNWPKKLSFDCKKEGLHYMFRSDGSINYWGCVNSDGGRAGWRRVGRWAGTEGIKIVRESCFS